MFKAASITLALLGALFLVAGCGDDGDGKKDKGVTIPDTGTTPDTGGTTDTGGGTHDTGGGSFTKGPNTGKVCDPTATTPCTGADECIGVQLTGWPSNKGVCVSRCNADTDCAKQAGQGTACGVSDKTTGKKWCIFLCEFSGTTYTCPDTANEACYTSTQAGVKLCGPKKTGGDAGL